MPSNPPGRPGPQRRLSASASPPRPAPGRGPGRSETVTACATVLWRSCVYRGDCVQAAMGPGGVVARVGRVAGSHGSRVTNLKNVRPRRGRGSQQNCRGRTVAERKHAFGFVGRRTVDMTITSIRQYHMTMCPLCRHYRNTIYISISSFCPAIKFL